MRILLDAYFDNNFGDDIFVNTLLNRYPSDQFYVFWEKIHPAVLNKAMGLKNLVILPQHCSMKSCLPFDGYVMVGGDVLPNGMDFTQRINNMRYVKECGGFVAMQGFNLYEDYGEQTTEDIKTMAHLADAIVPRDKASAERFRRMVPDVEVTESTDMAFTCAYNKTKADNRDILGIAPRRKMHTPDEQHYAYCKSMAAVADGWLKKHPEGIARFFAFSTGEFDDTVTIRDIISFMTEYARTEIILNTEDLSVFLDSLRDCKAMLPTRFHALVFALIFEIPFVAVPYEVKLKQLLNELEYTALRIPYGVEISPEMTAQAIEELDMDQVDPKALQLYYRKAVLFFRKLDAMMEQSRNKPRFIPEKQHVFGCTSLKNYSVLEQEQQHLKEMLNVLRAEKEAMEHSLHENSENYRKQVEALSMRNNELELQNANLQHLYSTLLTRANSFRGLLYLIVRKFYHLFKKI